MESWSLIGFIRTLVKPRQFRVLRISSCDQVIMDAGAVILHPDHKPPNGWMEGVPFTQRDILESSNTTHARIVIELTTDMISHCGLGESGSLGCIEHVHIHKDQPSRATWELFGLLAANLSDGDKLKKG